MAYLTEHYRVTQPRGVRHAPARPHAPRYEAVSSAFGSAFQAPEGSSYHLSATHGGAAISSKPAHVASSYLHSSSMYVRKRAVVPIATRSSGVKYQFGSVSAVKATKEELLASRAKVAGQAYLVADVASLSLKAGHVVTRFGGEGTNPGLGGALQLTSAVGMAAGVTNILAYKQVHATAKKVDYVWGQQEAQLKMIRGGAEVACAANVAAGSLFDCLTYDGFVTASKSSFTAMNGLSYLSSVAGSVRYMTVFAYSAKNLSRARDLGNSLEGLSEKEAVDHLMGMIELTDDERREIFRSAPDIAEPLTDEEKATLSYADMEAMTKGCFTEARGNSVLKEIARVKKGREMDLAAKTSGKVVKMLREDSQKDYTISQRMADECPEASKAAGEIVEEAKKTSTSHVKMNALVMAMCAVAIIAVVLADVYTGGLFHVVLLGISFVISSGWLVMDWQMIQDSFKSDEKGKHDEILKWIVNAIVVAVSALSIVYTAGTPILIMGIASALLMLSVNFGIWYKNKHVKHIRETELSVGRRVIGEVATGAMVRVA